MQQWVFPRQALGLPATPETTDTGLCFTLQGAERHAKSLALAADAGYRDCYCRGEERQAESLACKLSPARMPRALMPNPSLNRTRYGRQRKPGPRHMVHHLVPGLRCLPPRAG